MLMSQDKTPKPDLNKAREILEGIAGPEDLVKLNLADLDLLALAVREAIISTVSETGGHLSSSLGVVELTLALLKTFDFEKDRLIWDVGHQCYAYKLLTGRQDRFHTLRTRGGLSGFPKPEESRFDHFGVGHSSTSISAALGMAVARDYDGRDNKVIAVIGDGAMTAGLAFEGLNQAGDLGRNLIVILNDNNLSISPNVGALSTFLSLKLSRPWVRGIRKDVGGLLKSIPAIGDDVYEYAKRGKHALKGFFTPGELFEAFHFEYIGPVDGHNLEELLEALKLVQAMDGPVLLHVQTQKGFGYPPAEKDPTYFHGVGSFNKITGVPNKFNGSENGRPVMSYTAVMGRTLCRLAEDNPKIVAITAAMSDGTGLSELAHSHPDRVIDVGICEQHAVTFAAGLASQGYRPVVAIYSSFLQRAYDQIVHDVCLQNLPVVFCVDRAGLVGADGPTHHGVFDLSYLRHIPNLAVMAPKDEAELQDMLHTALRHNGPIALRYPRGRGVGVDLPEGMRELPIGRGEVLLSGSDILILALGYPVHEALAAALELEKEHGLQPTVFNARFASPLPREQILDLARRHKHIVTVEENVLAGGFSAAVLECLADADLLAGHKLRRLAVPDAFIEHGPQKELRALAGIDRAGILKAVLELKDSE